MHFAIEIGKGLLTQFAENGRLRGEEYTRRARQPGML